MAVAIKGLRIAAAALGRRMGITVRIDPHARTAYTDGKQVVLPVLPMAGPQDEEDLFLGLVAHEAFHIRFTYLKGVYDGAPPDGVTNTPFIKQIQNALEDARIEKLGGRKYRGAPKLIAAMIQYGITNGWFSDQVEPDEKPGNLVTFGLLYHYRAHFLGQHALDSAAVTWGAAAQTAFGSDVWDQVLAIADKSVVASTCHGPDGPWLAAQAIADLLQEAGESQQPDQGEDQGESQDQANPGNGQSNGQDPGQSQNEGAGQGESQGESDQEPQGGSQDQANPSKGYDLTPQQAENCRQAIGSSEDDMIKVDVADMAEKDLQEKAQAHQYENITESEPRHRVSDAHVVKASADVLYRQIAGPLEAKLWAQAQEEVFTSRTGTSGVVPTALHRHATTGQIFARRLEGDTRTMAVQVLLDLSGSMGEVRNHGQPAHIVSASAMALSRLFSSLDIQYSISWFGSSHSKGREFSSAPLRQNEKWEMDCLAGTCLAQAMNLAATGLVYREETRRILIVLTDGDADLVATKATDEALAKEGIEVRYVLIGDSGQEITSFAESRCGRAKGADAGKALIDAFRKAV